MKTNFTLSDLNNLPLNISSPCIIFLHGDLGTGKTTLSSYILNNILKIDENITSPTYTYYNKYQQHYHFDLYRLENYDEFFAIGWEDILDNNSWVILIEWPDVLKWVYSADIEIFLKNTDKLDTREIEIVRNK